MSDSIFTIDSTFIDTMTGLTFPVRNHLISQFETLKNQRKTLLQTRSGYTTQYLSEALSHNNLVEGDTDPVSNEKTVNFISHAYVTGGIENISNSYSTLLSIANQCPYKGGKAVYRARTFVSLFNEDVRYDDYNICLQEGIHRSGYLNNPLHSNPISIIPNPANENIEVVLHGKTIGICYVVVSDVHGKTVMSDQFDCANKKHKLNVSHLTPGVYIVYVDTNGENKLFEKLVIIR
jgi:hypothetical protein